MFPTNFTLGIAGQFSNDTILIGENNLDESGWSVSSIGDLNGDGIPELLIGVPDYPSGNQQGATYVVSGASINLDAGGSISLNNYATPGAGIVMFVGENNFDDSGCSVSSIVDLNGDGIPELLIGVPYYPNGSGLGATYVVSGASINLNAGGSISLNNYATPGAGIVMFVGENNLDQSGYSVNSIVDLNGDGIPELLIGAPGYPNGSGLGATYVVSGASINLNAGGSISLNNYATPGAGIVMFVGENNLDESGWSVSSIGDLNGDGIPELLIGAYGYPSNNQQGATYVVSGASINLDAGGSISLNNYATPGAGIVMFVGENNGDSSGYSVNSIVDLNGDGIPELLIGAPGYPDEKWNNNGSGLGATYVVSGASINLNAGGSISLNNYATPEAGIVMFVGENGGDYSGWSVNSIVDLNGDGIPELLIGAPYYPSSNAQGATYVVSGASINLAAGGNISLTPAAGIGRLVGENNFDLSGWSVNSIGDLNGDGIPDLLIGAPSYSNATAQGATYVVSGAALNSCILSNSPEEALFVNEVQQHRIIDAKNIDEINRDIVQLHIRNAENADTQLHRAVRNTEDDSFSLRMQPMWHDLPIIHAGQIPLVQTGVHLLKQGYNGIVNWLQGKDNTEQVTANQELISTEQAAEALNGYNNVSKQLESIIGQLELDSATNKALVSWYKESLAEHQEQGKQLLDKPIINQELLIDYCENIQALANDLSEFAQQQVSDNLALSYIKAELAATNQALANLAEVQFGTIKNIEMLNDLPAQMQADNTQHILYEDVTNLSINNTESYSILNDSSLLIGEVPLLLG